MPLQQIRFVRSRASCNQCFVTIEFQIRTGPACPLFTLDTAVRNCNCISGTVSSLATPGCWQSRACGVQVCQFSDLESRSISRACYNINHRCPRDWSMSISLHCFRVRVSSDTQLGSDNFSPFWPSVHSSYSICHSEVGSSRLHSAASFLFLTFALCKRPSVPVISSSARRFRYMHLHASLMHAITVTVVSMLFNKDLDTILSVPFRHHSISSSRPIWISSFVSSSGAESVATLWISPFLRFH